MELIRRNIKFPFPTQHIEEENINKLPAGWTEIIEINRVAGGGWTFFSCDAKQKINFPWPNK